MRRLVTIPLSHFCEKARWALDLSGAPYREDGWPPVVHRLPLARYRATTAPVLVVGDGTVLRESSDIARHADDVGGLGLFGRTPGEHDEIERLVVRFDEVLGPAARLSVYARVLDDPPTFIALASSGLSPGRRSALERLRPVVGMAIRRRFAVSDETREQAEASIACEFALADARRAGRPYLVGDRFTAADLAFAALAAPLVFVSQYGVDLPPLTALSPEVQALATRWRATPSGAAVLDLYARHRRPEAAAVAAAAAA